jgi:hypothetical protein
LKEGNVRLEGLFLIMYVHCALKQFRYSVIVTVCLKWILLDPKVGSWLLDPDHPPGQFADALHAMGVQVVRYI